MVCIGDLKQFHCVALSGLRVLGLSVYTTPPGKVVIPSTLLLSWPSANKLKLLRFPAPGCDLRFADNSRGCFPTLESGPIPVGAPGALSPG